MTKSFKWTIGVIGAFVFFVIISAFYSINQKKHEELTYNQEVGVVDSSGTTSYVKKVFSETDAAATLDFIQLTEVIIKNISEMHVSYNSDATIVTLIPKHIENRKFIPFNNWQSIKVIRTPDFNKWKIFMVEVFDSKGYEESKNTAFSICRNIWDKIDERVPTVIDELTARLEEYEKTGALSSTQHIRYGYLFSLDASHFKDGYPITCAIAYNEK